MKLHSMNLHSMKLHSMKRHSVTIASITLLAFLATGSAQGQSKPKVLEGAWLGTLKIGPQALRLVLKLKAKGDGYIGLMDSPDQGAANLPLSDVEFKEGQVTVGLKNLGAKFEGKLNKEGSEIAGAWKQGGLDLPLTFKRLDKAPDFSRPQDPKKPYPYLENEVTYENAKAKIKLAGTLTIPKGNGPFPAVIMITGSGPQDRDETIFGHKPFLVWADYLTRQGIAVLRVDDRGVGKSTGKQQGSTSADFADDVEAGIEFLKTWKAVDPRRIGLIGHSEGGIIAPMVATRSKDVAFIVLLAGTGLPGSEISTNQIQTILKTSGVKEDLAKWNLGVQRRIVAIFQENLSDKDLKAKVDAVLKEEVAKLPEADQKLMEKMKPAMQAQLSSDSLPWTRFFMKHDP